MSGIYSALSGAIAQERSLEVVANNLANASTSGYRGDRVTFQEMVAPDQAADPDVVQSSRYVTANRVVTNDAPGAIRQTENPLDVALQGDGWFVVNTPGGERYTRSGSFITDRDGTLRTQSGLEVQDVSGRSISLPLEGGQIRIASDGAIFSGDDEVAQLRVVQFADNNQLQKEGLTLFSGNAAQAQEATDTTVLQGFLETSNVNAVHGMTELINTSRSFEAFQKVIESFKQIDSLAARNIASR